MEIIRSVIGWGNGAGVLLPKGWEGNQVKIILIDRSQEIKKEVFDILDLYLEDILGIYLVGSYARGEQDKDSDIDIVAVSGNTSKTIKSGKYEVSIVKLNSIRSSLKKHPILMLPRLIEAKTILNSSLLEELKSVKITKNSFSLFMEECKRIIRINQTAINIDKAKKEVNLSNPGVAYSLVLRLRGIYIINQMTSKKKYSKNQFLAYLERYIDKKELEKVYRVYEFVKLNKKVHETVSIEIAEKLLSLLRQETRKLENEAKKEVGKGN